MRVRSLARFFAVALAGMALAAGAAEARGGWALPKADADRWANRVRSLLPDGWAVSARGNDLIIRRIRPVRFARVEINAPAAPGPDRPPADLREGRYRLTLRFAPKMGHGEYERLAAENAAAGRERDRLHRAVGLPHKFDDFIATTPEERGRVRAYREAVRKLTWHRLPDLYTPDHSIFLYHSQDGWSYVHDKEVAAECLGVRETLLRYFGMYDPQAAANRREVGGPEPRGER